ncbi:hypothetical protein ACFLYN_00365 [Chloroflexota bacterium]
MTDNIYKCLSPVGIQDPVEQIPLAPRLDRLEGKNIVFSIGAGGEQDILIPLTKRLPEDYPDVNWNIVYAAEHKTIAGSSALSEEQMKTTDAVVRGVVW